MVQSARTRGGGRARGAGERLSARSVVLTTGTFLRGMIHVGSASRAAGRMPAVAAAPRARAPAAGADPADEADTVAAVAAGALLPWLSPGVRCVAQRTTDSVQDGV